MAAASNQNSTSSTHQNPDESLSPKRLCRINTHTEDASDAQHARRDVEFRWNVPVSLHQAATAAKWLIGAMAQPNESSDAAAAGRGTLPGWDYYPSSDPTVNIIDVIEGRTSSIRFDQLFFALASSACGS